MNNERRKELMNLIARLQRISSKINNIDFSIVDSIVNELNDIKDDEEYKLNNLEGGLAETENAYNIQKAIDNLEDAINNLEQLSDFDFNVVDELITNLEELK